MTSFLHNKKIPIKTENWTQYGRERNLNENQKFIEINSTSIDVITLNFFFIKNVLKKNKESTVSSLCNQVVVSPPMASHLSTKDDFAKGIGLVRKFFYSFEFFDIFIREEKRTHESTRNLSEVSEILLGFCNRPAKFLCNVC